jgi:Protein of unknown function (DUF4238)
MPDKKSQHFVPQFYLRNFSSDRRKCIGLYNIPSDRLVPWGASIRDQACKDYFYGKDANLEDAFNILETAASRVISDIINNNKLPNRNNEDYRTLTTFMSIQDSRTVNSTGRINDTLNAFRRVAELNFTTNKDRPERGLENRLHEAKPLEILMKGALFTEPLLLDLKDKLIVNKSLIPFITSDHPLVKHNQLYMRMENIPIGLACEGIQLFFPISPEHMIVFTAVRLSPGRLSLTS